MSLTQGRIFKTVITPLNKIKAVAAPFIYRHKLAPKLQWFELTMADNVCAMPMRRFGRFGIALLYEVQVVTATRTNRHVLNKTSLQYHHMLLLNTDYP